MNRLHFALSLAVVALVTGCASLYKCGVFYEASAPADKLALAGRFSALRQALSGDSRFEEKTEQGFQVRFFGLRGSEFESLAVGASELAGSSTMVVIYCPYEERSSARVMKLRKIVEDALGIDVMRRLQGQVRYTMLAKKKAPNQSLQPTGPSARG